jgi:hypothetical protein
MTSYLCNCPSCRVRSALGPVLVMTVGVLLLFQVTGWGPGFNVTWPILVIVVGVFKLAQAVAPSTGHRGLADFYARPGSQPPSPPPPSPV